jgi:trk system potassium uptake protein TrkH
MVLGLCAWSRFRGDRSAPVFRRRISQRSVERAITTVLLFAAVAAIGLGSLLITEHTNRTLDPEALFLNTSFEVASALGTVGLSTGVTPQLSDGGKVVVMILMLVGRLGPISVFIALSRVEEAPHLAFPQEDVLVG